MQPVLMVTATVQGLVYLNGRAAGEAGPEDVVSLPVAPRGALYLELRPLVGGYLPVARRVTLAGGRVVPGSITDGPGLSAVMWPGGVVDIELAPESLAGGEAEDFRGTPDDPDAVRLEDGSIRLIEELHDTVGHARLRGWTMNGGRWAEKEPEILWAQGAPRWPSTAEDTALAAVEAWLLGLMDEARGYFTPGPAGQGAAQALTRVQADACVRMKYPMPGGSSAVGLLALLGENCAQVRPLYYSALPMAGPQGAWRLEGCAPEE